MIRFTAIGAVLLASAMPAVDRPPKAAVFDFQFSNLSPVPTDAADIARLKRVSDAFRALRKEKEMFTLVSTAPVRAAVAKGAELRQCNGCAETYARRLGADAAITGEVEEVSTLLLNLNVYVEPLADHAAERAYSVDMRGDTDESFDRTIRFLARNDMEADDSLGHH